MNISTMPILERYPRILKLFATALILKPVIYSVVNKHYLCWSLNLIWISTVVDAFSWNQLLSCSMSYHFLLGCISLCSWVAIWVTYYSCVKSSLIMVAHNIEHEVTIYWSNFIIRSLEIHTMFNMVQVGEQWVAAEPQNQIKKIYSNTYSDEATYLYKEDIGKV